MHYHIGNVCCVVVKNFHGLIFQVHNQISTIEMLAPPSKFMSINTLHFLLCTEEAISIKRNSVNYVMLLHMQLYLKSFIQKRACHYGVINSGIPSRIIHFFNTETYISPTTCTHS